MNEVIFNESKSCVIGFVSWAKLKGMIESTGNNEEVTHFEITDQGINFGVANLHKDNNNE